MEPSIPTTDPKLITQEPRRGLLRTPSFVIGLAIALFWFACVVAPGLFTTWGEHDVVRDSTGDVITRAAPQADAWFGTDSIGRDVLARVVYGAENTVVTALLAALVAVLAGAAIGLVMGTSRGWIDEALSRTVEAVVSLPVVLLALMVSVIYPSSRLVLVLMIASLSAPLVATAVRSVVLVETPGDGESDRSQTFPNISLLLVVELTVRVRYAIFAVATLSFLGFGVGDAREADWGRDFAQTYPMIQAGRWWSAFFPALAITSLALATNLIGGAADKAHTEGLTPGAHRITKRSR